ncbi:topology modulation protein [Altererythrobacter litoralis]|uniref:Topology modulation protein n=1 Tax=Altererythrobacter litoralis TaxID=3113904 RepID=A0ABU7GHL4_9SPHN|nr:topology modulation protein [Erythrobacteraceae bacterium 1XM1-14]
MAHSLQRVLIVGPCGAGKSTFGFALAEAAGLPLFHMDRLNWKPGWIESTDEELRARLREVVAGERWIIEGTYGGTLDERLPGADTVVYLDYPIPLCFWRVLKRILTWRGRARPDMPEGCPERLDLSFLLYVARWNHGPRRRLEGRIGPYRDKMVRLCSSREAQCWLDSLARR